MATIKCASCGRLIQDWEKTCLYCNAPNTQYKEKTYTSFGESSFSSSFGSSFDSGSFGSSFGSSFGDSSFSEPIGSKEFSDFTPAFSEDKHSFDKDDKYQTEYEKPSDSAPRKGLSSFFEQSETTPQKVVSKEEHHSMGSFFDSNPAPREKQNEYAALTSYIESKQTVVPVNTEVIPKADPVDYRAKLDQYRKEKGYGEYSKSSSVDKVKYGNPNSKSFSSSYKPNANVGGRPNNYSYGSYTSSKSNGPIDPPSTRDYYDFDDFVKKEKEKDKNSQAIKIIVLVIVLYFLQFVLSFISMW